VLGHAQRPLWEAELGTAVANAITECLGSGGSPIVPCADKPLRGSEETTGSAGETGGVAGDELAERRVGSHPVRGPEHARRAMHGHIDQTIRDLRTYVLKPGSEVPKSTLGVE
jgi:hypothetical protein